MKIIIVLILINTFALAKRLPPTPVESIQYKGIEYSAPHSFECKACVEAKDTVADTLIWKREIYSVRYDSGLERDVQDVFIKELKIENDTLTVINELNQIYKVGLTPKKLKSP